MKAVDFDKVCPIYRSIEDKCKIKCLKDGVDFWEYYGNFTVILFKYSALYKKLLTIKSLDFTNKLLVRATLNKAHFSDKDSEFNMVEREFLEVRLQLFQYLDKLDNPYFYILNPIYRYGAGISYKSYVDDRHGYLKDPRTGITNLDIAFEYLNYKLEK